jgi:hypothetical protein
MTNVIKMHLLLRVYADIFPKTPRFFTISFNQVNDVDVKIYETQLTANHILCFLNQKTG